MKLSPESAEVVKGVVELFSDPNKWTSEVAARDADGLFCPSISPRACRWCAVGAINKIVNEVAHYSKWESIKTEIYAIFEEENNAFLSEVNDYKGREAVIEKLSALIA